jgi:dipeptidyl-peptidase-4
MFRSNASSPRAIGGVLGLLALSAGAIAQDRLADLPGYQDYKRIADNLGRLVVGGTITNVMWDDDGAWLAFSHAGTRWRCDLETGALAEAAPPRDDSAEDDPARNERRRPQRPDRGRQRDRETSPDGAWVAACESWNLVLRRAGDDAAPPVRITADGYRKHRYGTASWVYGEELNQTTAMCATTTWSAA